LDVNWLPEVVDDDDYVRDLNAAPLHFRTVPSSQALSAPCLPWSSYVSLFVVADHVFLPFRLLCNTVTQSRVPLLPFRLQPALSVANTASSRRNTAAHGQPIVPLPTIQPFSKI